jgi:hypothetical protein
MTRIYEELVDFIAGTSPITVAEYHPSDAAKARVIDLVDREKSTQLTPDEKSELEHYLQLEHLMRLAKAKAQQHLAHD